jgi:hypothetical protein
MKNLVTCVTFTLAIHGAATARADSAAPAEVTPGSRLRVSAPALSAHPFEGTVAAVEDDALILRIGPATQAVRIGFAEMSRLELRTRKDARNHGILVGALTGAAIVVSVAAINGCGGGWRECYRPALVLGGAAGSLAGFALSHAERWQSLSPRSRRQVSLSIGF